MRFAAKLRLLYEEMLTSRKYGPDTARKSGEWSDNGDVIMYDASPLARKLAPEISLHFSSVGTPSRRLHKLEYVVISGVGSFRATIHEVKDWLEDNAEHIEREMLDEAISILWGFTESMEPSKRQPAYRGLTALRKELKSLGR